MARQRETPNDLKREAFLLGKLAGFMRTGYHKLPINKYAVDAVLVRDSQIMAWVECKWYQHTKRPGMNCAKYLEIMHLAARSRKPAYLMMRVPGKLGYITLGNCEPHWEIGGGNNGRQNLDDDVEPMVYWSFKDARWIEESPPAGR